MGKSNLSGMESENIVALCDVDDEFAAETYQTYPNARRYHDFRKMLESQSDIEAVLVATPDHAHAVIAKMAMEMGKHVYVQKPLCATVHESRVLARVAEETGVVTQMGNQGHSGDGAKLINQWVADGVLGDVREVHVWTNRPNNYWPQGVDRPTDTPPVPSTLQWDLFLGPAPERPYNPAYTPFKWRGWVDYGTGALGDMGAHLLDHPFWALGLEYPTTIETRFTPYNGESYPVATISYYEFPARGSSPPVKLTWYDGGLMPPRDPRMSPDDRVNPGGGAFIVGEKGTLVHGEYGMFPYVIPRTEFPEYEQPRPQFTRGQRPPGGSGNVVRNRHEMNWINAIKGEDEISCPFSYAAKLTETMLLGIVSLKAGGAKLEYDGQEMAFTNNAEANQFLHREYRDGWML
jgi:predicted dehydrogenase